MKAKFQGRCAQCRQTVLKGEEMTWLDGQVFCGGCTESGIVGNTNIDEIGKPVKEKCLSCWTVHAGECY